MQQMQTEIRILTGRVNGTAGWAHGFKPAPIVPEFRDEDEVLRRAAWLERNNRVTEAKALLERFTD